MNRLRELLRRHADLLIAAGLAVGYVVALLLTVHGLGYARDEGFYFQAAQSYEHWFELLLHDPRAALTRVAVDRAWSANHEHPALMKSLFALSLHFLYGKWHWLSESGTAVRFPGMLVSSLAIAVTYHWASRVQGRVAGLVAALSLALMPQVFYHSHLDCFDMPVASLWLVVTYAFWRASEAGGFGWPIVTGLCYGLLLDTKHNSWIFPFAAALHLLVCHGKDWRLWRHGGARALVAMLTIGPLVCYALWPWIWFDTVKRIQEYVAFHMGHEYYNMEFLGQTYWKPPMPRGYAWLMTLATVPGITLVLFGVGLVVSARGLLRERSERVLWLICIAACYAPWLSTRTPIFGGTKHWITAYPFLCLFAGVGFAFAAARIGELWRHRAVPIALAATVLVGPLVMTVGSHPWGLTFYAPVVGGAPGAATLGLNRTFWGYTTGAVQDYLNREMPRNGVLYVHDTALQSFEMLRRDGRVRSDLRGVLSISASDFAVYHHEAHMSRVEHQIWVDYGTVAPAYLGTYQGVPMVWVYARPR
jgi:4-amino-4-deoxy-L-arabinose transferase-like glycosyltransferase